MWALLLFFVLNDSKLNTFGLSTICLTKQRQQHLLHRCVALSKKRGVTQCLHVYLWRVEVNLNPAPPLLYPEYYELHPQTTKSTKDIISCLRRRPNQTELWAGIFSVDGDDEWHQRVMRQNIELYMWADFTMFYYPPSAPPPTHIHSFFSGIIRRGMSEKGC